MNKKIMPIFVMALLALMALPVLGADMTATITSPVFGFNTSDTTPEIAFYVNNSNHSTGIVTRIFVNGAINGWKNVTNSTTARYNLTTISDSKIRIRVEAWNESDSIGQFGSAFNSTDLNITVDATAPSLAVDKPTASAFLNPIDTGRMSIDLNTTITDATAGLDVCRYAIGRSNTGSTIIDVSNTTFTCGTSTAITPSRDGGSNILFVYANDSAGNIVQTTVSFNYAVIGTGGGVVGGGGGGSSSGSNTVVTQSVVQPSGTQASKTVQPTGSTDNNKYIILLVLLVGGYYLFKGKKKKSRR